MNKVLPYIIIFVILIIGGLLIFKGIKLNTQIGMGGKSPFEAGQKEKNKWLGAINGANEFIQSLWGGK